MRDRYVLGRGKARAMPKMFPRRHNAETERSRPAFAAVWAVDLSAAARHLTRAAYDDCTQFGPPLSPVHPDGAELLETVDSSTIEVWLQSLQLRSVRQASRPPLASRHG